MSEKKIRIAITGANGFVAKNLRRFLNLRKIPFIGIARKNYSNYKYETKIISPEYRKNDLLKKLRKCDALVHLIGIGNQSHDNDFNKINFGLTKKILLLCREAKIKKIVYLSGLGVSKKIFLDYFISKFKAEQEIINSGLDFTIYRPSYIIGKNDFLTRNLKKQKRRGLIKIPGSGKFLIQPIFVGDVVQLIFQSIISKNYSNKILDLVGPESVTFEKYVSMVVKKRKVKIKKISLEETIREAITNPNSPYSLDDLNILVGNFTGNNKTIKTISGMNFTPLKQISKTCGLP